MGDPEEVKSGKEDSDKVSVNFFNLFRYTSCWEVFLILLAVLFAVVSATLWPLLIIVYGEFTTVLVERALTRGEVSTTQFMPMFGGGEVVYDATDDQLADLIENDSLAYFIGLMIIGVLQMISGIFFVNIFNKVALKQITRIRIRFFRSIICQEMAWYDKSTDMNFASRITDDINKIRDGISEKLGIFLSLVFGFVINIGISIGYGGRLSLVVLAYIPLLLLSNYIVLKFQSKYTTKELDAHSSAGSVSEEVLRSIRTVVAFGGETKELLRYSHKLDEAQKSGKRRGIYAGIGEAIVRFLFYVCTAVAFWYGVSLTLDDRDISLGEREFTPAVIMIAFFGIIMGADMLTRSIYFLGGFTGAVASAETIFGVIDRKSKIDPLSRDGQVIIQGVRGEIEFKDVKFSYPSRPDVTVLKGFDLKVTPGQTVAIVGHSGSGKSTVVQLLQRFYDADSGSILIDNCDIKSMNTAWLRSNIAVVSQEPVLFATTVENNIRYGNTNATRGQIEDAAKASGVHDFIVRLPQGYDTQVGELGSQMSGGQKQRIAIARAIIQNPKILLLDEATSALDPHTGKLVEEMLSKVSKGRTTIVVTHKLSSIEKSDQIVLLEKGVIIEKGTHFNLMNMEGKYFDMIKTNETYQKQSQVEKGTEEKEVDVDVKEGERKKSTHSFKDQMLTKLQFSNKDTSKEAESKENDQLNHWQTFLRICKVSKPQWGLIFIGLVGASIVGASYPAFSVLMGNVYGALALPDREEVTSETDIMCICFLAVGVIVGLGGYLQNFMLNLAGTNLITYLRKNVFQAMLKQEMAWFDDESHSVGALCAALSDDTTNVRAILEPIGGIIGSLTTLLCGVSVAIIYSWKLGLVCLSFVPLVLISVILEAKLTTASMVKEKEAIERATQVATEAIANVRTVASLRQEEDIIQRYTKEIMDVEEAVTKKLSFRGYVFATVQAIPIFAYAVALYYGGILVAREGVKYQDLIKVSESLLYGAMMMGQSLAFVSALTAGMVGGSRLFKITDREPRIVSAKDVADKRKRDNESFVNFDNVNFRYPSRPLALILDNLNLEVLSGKTVALVGPSGCGKSTCVQLLQRMYDPDEGKIRYNDEDIARDLRIPDLRSRIGIVSQEPHLFDKTIAENIAYGDNSRTIPMEEIIAAAKMANIHSFIASLPLGYDTGLGSKGTQLSGGQKQRVAIARALVRNPKVLLLDEATSALDTESEKIVQQALDLAKTGRTCLIIAHRLTTIVNADLICVVQGGRIAEMGTHDELMEKNGLYKNLHAVQCSL